MDLEEIKTSFEAEGLLLAEVEYVDTEKLDEELRIVGGLPDFIKILKTMRIPVAFAYVVRLDAEDFLYGYEDDDNQDEPARDLCSVRPQMKDYSKHIGSVGQLVLFAPLSPKMIGFALNTKWYEEFIELQDAAIEEIDETVAGQLEDLRSEENRRSAQAMERVATLVGDSNFSRLKTQKARLAYAKLHIKGIEDLSDAVLKSAISDISAQMMATRCS